jgi:hypothetical protein
MSGINAFTRTPHKPTVYGPVRRSRLDLMGIRFAEGGEGGEGGAGGGAGGDGGENKNDKGGSEFTPPKDQKELDRILESRLAREREKFKDYDQLKKDRDELQKLRDEKKTDDEKALDAARAEGRNEVATQLASERVRFALEKALAGRNPDPGALLDLDRSQFVKDGKADADAIKTWVEANSKEVETKQESKRDPSQGKRADDDSSLEAGKSAYERRHPTKK